MSIFHDSTPIQRLLRKPLFHWGFGFFLFVLFTALFFWYYHGKFQQKLEEHRYTQLGFASVQFETVRTSYDTIAQTIFANIINRPQITELMDKAARTNDEKERTLLRGELYSALKPIYDNLHRENVRQLHFHLPGAISFLRFHRPGKYGDDLSGVRPSIVRVNATQQPVSGFEEGRVFNGFRHVFPLMHNSRFVGSVEISYSFNAIRRMLTRLQPAHYHFMLNKQIIHDKVWKTELQNYRVSDLGDDFYYDASSYTHSPASEYIPEERVAQINTDLAPQIGQALQRHENFSKLVQADNRWYNVTFLSIVNVEHQPAGYFISYAADGTIAGIIAAYKQQILIMFASTLLSVTLLMLYWRSVRHKHDTLHSMAMSDPLTRLANRANFIAVLQNSIRFSRRSDTPLSIIFFDIDHFKSINDDFGHDMGDEILIEVAKLVGSRIRQSDLFARWGGEEFAIILPQTSLEEAMRIAEKLRSTIEEYSFAHGKLTCSFGVTRLHKEDTDALLMKRVDTMLYSAKQHGRNNVQSVD